VALVTLAAIIAAASWYVVTTQRARERYLIGRQLRELAVLAEQIEGTLSAKADAFNGEVDRSETARIASTRSAKTDAPNSEIGRAKGLQECLAGRSSKGDVLDGGVDRAKREPEWRAALCEGLLRLGMTNCQEPGTTRGAQARETSDGSGTSGRQAQPDSPRAAQSCSPEVPVVGSTTLDLCVRAEHEPESTSPLRPESTTSHGWPSKKRTAIVRFHSGDICASMSLDVVVEPLLSSFGQRNVFLAIDRAIYYERGDRSLRLAQTRFSGGGTNQAPGATPDPVREEDLAATSASRDVEVAGRPFKLFSHPLRLGSGESAWWLGVLDPKDQFDAEASTLLSYGAVGYGVLALLLLLLSMPVLKVATMGPRDRLRARDIRVLALSLVLLVGGTTAFLLGFYANQALDTELDHDLHDVAHTLRDNFVREIEQVSIALDGFVGDRIRLRAVQAQGPDIPWCAPNEMSTPPPPPAPAVLVGLFGECLRPPGKATGCCAPESGCPSATWLATLKDAYPYLPIVYWTDARGKQQEKFSIASTVSPLVSIDDKQFFKDARDGRVWGLPRTRGLGPAALSVHVGQSKVWGSILAAVAMPILDDTGRFEGIVSATPHFVSVSRPVLPTDFAFAIIENDGRVVFPESQEHRLFEDFFEDVTVEFGTRAAIEARQERFLSGEYRGLPYRFLVTPIKFSPWTLVVMRNREKQLSHDLDGLLGWSIGFLVYLALGGVVWSVWCLLTPRTRSNRLWPSEASALQYRQCILVLAGSCATATWLLATRPSVSPRLFAVLVTIIGMCLACVRLLLNPQAQPPAALGIAARSRVVWLVLAVVCLAAMIQGTAFAAGLGAVLFVIAIVQAWRGAGGTRTGWRHDFVTVGVLILVLAVVVPSAALLRDSWELGMEAFVRNGQLKLAEDLERLQETNKTEYEQAGIDEKVLELRQRGLIGSSASGDGRSVNAEVVPGRIFGAALETAPSPNDRCVEAGDAEPFAGPIERLWRLATASGHVSAPILELLPIHSEDLIQTRELLTRQAVDERWGWTRQPDGTAQLCWYRLRRDRVEGSAETGRKSHQVSRIASTVPVPRLTPSGTWQRVGVIAGFLAFAGLLWLVLRWLAARIVGLDEEHGVERRPAEAQHARGLLLIGSGCPLAGERVHADVFDLSDGQSASGREETLGRVWSAAPVVLVQHLETALDDPARSEQALQLLETLVSRQPKPLVVCSETDPLMHFRKHTPPADTPATNEAARWARVLERLANVPAGAAPSDAESLVSLVLAVDEADRTGWLWLPTRASVPWRPDDVQQLADETRWTARLRGIAWEVWSLRPPAEGIVRRLEQVAGAHYRRLWLQCSEEEQLLLAQLVSEGLVNPRNWRLAQGLARAGLVRFTPAPQPMNESFRTFVEHEEPPARILAWERAEGKSLWDRTRGLLTYVLIAAGLVLYFAQPEGWAKLVGALSAIGSASSKLTDLSGVLGRARPQAGSK
jgi:hypothetical protein